MASKQALKAEKLYAKAQKARGATGAAPATEGEVMGDPEKRLNSRGHQRELQRQAAAYTGAGGGCLMALLLLPFTALLGLLRRK